MKSILSYGMLLLTAAAITFSSCKKDEDAGTPPSISFKTGGAYVAANTTVGMNAAVQLGITAAKTEDEDPLTLFSITRSYDNGAATQVYSETLSGASGDSYSKDFPVTTRGTAGTEKYTFTVSNRDGLTNSVSLTLTVQ